MTGRWAIFLSGRGSNAQAAFEELHQLDVALCVSSRKSALGLSRARRAGVPTMFLEKNPDWSKLTLELRKRKVNRIMLLGFMKILPAEFCQQWNKKMWNLHPSILPDFKGAEAIEKSYAVGQVMGVSIHEVTAEMDAGKVLKKKYISFTAKKDFASFELAAMAISRAEQGSCRRFMLNKSFCTNLVFEKGI